MWNFSVFQSIPTILFFNKLESCAMNEVQFELLCGWGSFSKDMETKLAVADANAVFSFGFAYTSFQNDLAVSWTYFPLWEDVTNEQSTLKFCVCFCEYHICLTVYVLWVAVCLKNNI